MGALVDSVLQVERREVARILGAARLTPSQDGSIQARTSFMVARIMRTGETALFATGRYLGEGFDDSRLDTLFLTMPIAWKGTLAQYAGRLHRLNDAKREVIIYMIMPT